MNNLFRNIPPVTKNLLIINILFYIATLIMAQRGVNLIFTLGAHYINTPFFEPYQIVTHFFMHSTQIFHILFNMMILVMLGSHLENLWGPKRFFTFYMISALGSFALYNGIGVYQVMEIKSQLQGLGYSISDLDYALTSNGDFMHSPDDKWLIDAYVTKAATPMVGASGAMFGILAAFAYLFPNTEFMMMFIPIPIKAKYFVLGYFVLEVYLGLQNIQGDSVAHFAHVGGAIAGIIMVLLWNRNRSQFY